MDYAGIRTVIADQLNRTDLGTQINREINNAIEHYEPVRAQFNEVRDWTVATTVSGTKYYSLTSNFLLADQVKVVYSGSYITLAERTWSEIDRKDTDQAGNILGLPYEYTIRGREIRLFPVPNGAYSLEASYVKSYPRCSLTGSHTFSGSSTHTGTSTASGSQTHTGSGSSTASQNNRSVGWTVYAHELITERAKAAVKIKYLRDQGAIQEQATFAVRGQDFLSFAEEAAWKAFARRQTSFFGTGRIEPYGVG